MTRTSLLAAALAACLGLAAATAHSQALGTAFTYQGELQQAGAPADGSYDFQFRLFDAPSGGAQIGPTVDGPGVLVRGGLFALPLDFGPGQFAGDAQWLQIAVRPSGSGPYTTLDPRTPITPTPYALGAAVALGNSVTGLSIVDGSVGSADINAAQVQRRITGSCPAGQYIRLVNQDGSVSCGTDAGGGVTSIATGAGLTGGPITASGTIAIANGGVGTTQINSAQVQRRITGSCSAGQYVRVVNQDGTVTCGTDTSGPAGWGLTGNAGTNPAQSFLGTTDIQPLVLRTGNAQSLRIEPVNVLFNGLPITSNIIAGSSANSVATGVRGATIAGGGVPSGNSDPSYELEAPNRVTADYGVVGGGYANRAGDESGVPGAGRFSTVAGGARNVASAPWSSVGGGDSNVASGSASALGGGDGNVASGQTSTLGGGLANIAAGDASSVGGGARNSASALFSAISGGADNTVSGERSAIAGGSFNLASGRWSMVGGGEGNTSSGWHSAIVGGSFNTASAAHATIGGGSLNCAGGPFSWAGGFRAKVRPGAITSSTPGTGCMGVPGLAFDGDVGTFVWSDSQPADFVSSGANQFLIRASGGMAINTNTPRAPLTVTTENNWNPTIGNGWGDFTVGDSTRGLAVGVATGGGGAGSVRLWAKGGVENISFTNATLYPAELLHIGASGRVGVGRIAAANAFEVNGNASKSTAGDWLSNSDARIKTAVAEIDSPLERLLRLRPVTFRYTEAYLAERPAIDDVEYYNVIAQEYAEVFPDAVKPSGEYLPGKPETAENAVLQVDFHPASVLTVAAVQELAVRLAELEAENVTLRERLADIERRLAD